MLLSILAEGAEPTAWGLNATGWVAVGMLIVFAILLWAKVPKIVGAMLDKQIAEIKNTLDEAANLRRDAEALKAEYEAKTAGAKAEAETMLANAEKEASLLVEKAMSDTEALVARRQKMAEEKIAAAERAAIAAVRAKAASAATKAAEMLIVAQHDAKADKSLVDAAINEIGNKLN